MTNDAKLGMVAGVAGVIVAAVLLSNAPPRAEQSKSGTKTEPAAKEKLAAQPQTTPSIAPTAAVTPAAPTEAKAVSLPSTPLPRTRKDIDAQPASRQSGMEEEP